MYLNLFLSESFYLISLKRFLNSLIWSPIITILHVYMCTLMHSIIFVIKFYMCINCWGRDRWRGQILLSHSKLSGSDKFHVTLVWFVLIRCYNTMYFCNFHITFNYWFQFESNCSLQSAVCSLQMSLTIFEFPIIHSVCPPNFA